MKGSMSVMLIVISPAHNTESGTWKIDKIYLLSEEEGTYTHTHTHSLIHSHMDTLHKNHSLQSCPRDPKLASTILSAELVILLERCDPTLPHLLAIPAITLQTARETSLR